MRVGIFLGSALLAAQTLPTDGRRAVAGEAPQRDPSGLSSAARSRVVQEAGRRGPQPEVRIAFMGDTGTGDERQARVRDELLHVTEAAGLHRVFLLGDNIYENGDASDFEAKFLSPYLPLMESGVSFHAALGNHDVQKCDASAATPLPRNGLAYRDDSDCWVQDQLETPEFGYPNGDRYYSVTVPPTIPVVEVFVLDTNTLDLEQSKLEDRVDEAQLNWLRRALQSSAAAWKVMVMHHPMYSPEGDGFLWVGHAAEEALARRLLPILTEARVDAVFQGHNHMYARLKPRDGIRYFVAGAGGAKPYRFKPDAATVERDDRGRFNHFVYARITRTAFEYCVIDDVGDVRDGGRFEHRAAADTPFGEGACGFLDPARKRNLTAEPLRTPGASASNPSAGLERSESSPPRWARQDTDR